MTIVEQADHSTRERGCIVVTSLHRHHRCTTLRTAGTRGSAAVVVAAVPDRVGATRRLRALRRIDRVDVVVGPEVVMAEIRGRRHRLPFTGPVSLAVALGLAELGVRTVIVDRGE